MRSIIFGGVLLLLGVFFTWDSFNKSSWAQVQARVVSVETKCDMKSTSYGVLTKTTSTATIDCADTNLFQNLHPDKSWTVIKVYTAHVLVPGQDHAMATTLSVGQDFAPGTMLTVSQSPKSPGRVQLSSTVAQGMGFAWIVLGVGALLTLWGVLRINRRRKLIAALREAAMTQAGMAPDAGPAPNGSAPSFASNPAGVARRQGFGRRS